VNVTDLWWYKHNPTSFEDLILNDQIKPTLEKALEEVPNLMLIGPPGVGKSAYAKILLAHTGYDHMWINASIDRGIDIVRTQIVPFGRALGITPIKIIVLNEADQLTPEAEKSLKEEIDDIAELTRFVFITNEPHNVGDAIHSRCQVIEVDKPPAKEIFYRLNEILEAQGVEIKNVLLKDVIKECYPDIRGMINSLQMSAVNGIIKRVIYSVSEQLLSDILSAILKKDVEQIRKLLRSNTVNYKELYNYLFNNAGKFKSPGDSILAIGEAHRWSAWVSIQEINFMYMVFTMIREGAV
jgi:DNA polymerase III delta prime subunit